MEKRGEGLIPKYERKRCDSKNDYFNYFFIQYWF